MQKKSSVPKKQHFVPQFLQRYFSYEDNQKQIGQFNIVNEHFEESTSIDGQLQKKYYYGKSGKLEIWLKELENRSAPIFRKMWEKEILPDLESINQLQMLHFIIVLDLRNPNRLEIYDKHKSLDKEKENEFIYKSFESLKNEDEKLKLLIKAVEIVPKLIDFKFKLLKNETKAPFIISDNPLIIYNQFLENRKYQEGSHRGYDVIGLQFFLPLNSEYMLIIYDKEIYKVGNKKEKVVEINDVETINQLNLLQFLNSTDTIIFNHKASEHYIRTIFEKSKKIKKANYPIIKHHNIIDNKGNQVLNEKIGELGVTDLKINLFIPKIKFLAKSKSIKFHNRLDLFRKDCKPSEKHILNNYNF